MENPQVNIPLTIALTDDQVQQIKEKLAAQIVDTLKGTRAGSITAHVPQAVVKSEMKTCIIDPDA